MSITPSGVLPVGEVFITNGSVTVRAQRAPSEAVTLIVNRAVAGAAGATLVLDLTEDEAWCLEKLIAAARRRAVSR